MIQVLVFLAATALLAPLFRKARLSAVMGFLLIGVLIGPHVMGQLGELFPVLAPLELANTERTRLLAEFGIVFLLFAIGLEVSTERLRAMRRLVLGLGLSQMALTAAAITGLAIFFGADLRVAAVIGLALALSSTAVVLQWLGEKRRLAAPVGRAGFSVLLMQDLTVIPILFFVGALGAGMEAADPMQMVRTVAIGAGAVVAIFVGGRLLLRPLFRWAASVESREVFVAAALLAVIGAAAASQAAGLSMALGAFLAGLLLAETEFRHQVETDIEPFKGLLLGLFFVTVGMQIDIGLAAADPLRIALGLIGLFVVKALIIAPLARLFGLKWPQAVELGFLLGQAGEFAFVVLALARAGNIIADVDADFLLLLIALSIFVTPLVADLGARLGRLLPGRPAHLPNSETAEAEGHVVIAGFGRVGQALADILTQQEIAHVAIDGDTELVARMRKKEWPVMFGDAGRRDVLASVGAANASAIVITINDSAAIERLVTEAKSAWPDVPIYARARDPAQARRLHDAGAALASPENIEATLQLGEALLTGLGVPEEAARRIIDERREIERNKSLSATAP